MVNFAAWWQILKQTISEWSDDEAPRLGAALAYYTVFSLAPLLIIVIAIAGRVFDPADVQRELNTQFKNLMGPEGQQAITSMIAAAQKPKSGLIATVIGVVALLFGATGLFVELKSALNTIWQVRLKPGRGFWGMIRDYYLSFALVVGIGFLLLVMLVISAALAAVLAWFQARVPLPAFTAYGVEFLVSFIVVTLLFALIFMVLPDVEIAWRDVWLGAVFTSLLFNLGKFLIGLYIGQASFGSSYGAAGTILVVLVWSYYSAQILLLGAEFTQVYAKRSGTEIRPNKNAESTAPAAPPAAKGRAAVN
ncbi:MAG TPA: YihY/virulence factor BrkB family protein [Pirellulales bacterium]|nr:YihY/virulence factor BrkB family protein [Pirellulales bacterium]